MQSPIVRIKACLNGGRRRDEHPAVPILTRLDELAIAGPRLLHGEEAACWPLVVHAGRLGPPTRIGLEDTVVGPAGLGGLDRCRATTPVRTAVGDGGRADLSDGNQHRTDVHGMPVDECGTVKPRTAGRAGVRPGLP